MPDTLPVLVPRRILALLVSLLAVLRRGEERVEVSPAIERTSRSSGHDQGDDHLLERPRNTGCDTRGRPGRRDFHRTRAAAGRRWQFVQGPGVQGATRYAVGVR